MTIEYKSNKLNKSVPIFVPIQYIWLLFTNNLYDVITARIIPLNSSDSDTERDKITYFRKSLKIGQAFETKIKNAKEKDRELLKKYIGWYAKEINDW